MASHPAISINVVSVSNTAIATAKLNTLYIVGTKGTGNMPDNTIAQIKTLAEYDSLIGADGVSRPDYNFIRKIDPAVPIYFVNGRDVAAGQRLPIIY
jgi:hypothetical protein